VPSGSLSSVWQDAPDFGGRPILHGVSQWGIDTLIRDLLATGCLFGSRRLQRWREFADIGNRLHTLEDQIYGDHPHREGDVLYELFRIAHRQFPWQNGMSKDYMARYVALYRSPELAAVIEAEFGVSFDEIFRWAVLLFSAFSKGVRVDEASMTRMMKGDQAARARLIDRVALELPTLRKMARDSSIPDINFAYRPNPLREKPIIHAIDEAGGPLLYCPVPAYLLERLLDGLYYDVVNRKDFPNAYGRAFQWYVEEVCRSAASSKLRVLGEAKYGHQKLRRDSIDLILSDDSGDLFIECKTRRVSRQAKVDLRSTSIIAQEMEKMSESIFQSYKTLNDALNGGYAHWQSRRLPSYLLIVLLNPWYITGPKLWEHVFDGVKTRLTRSSIPVSILSEAPPTICSIAELEALARVLSEVSLDRVLSQKVEAAYSQWLLGTYLNEHFANVLARQSNAADGFRRQMDNLLSSFKDL
jgi:hypothetical protein